ncbi:hypothetical protein FQN54_000721 [Arachnomyces sp. PD_36]|nr:hypothetical protein FQN54_000721 [Arachnomyces sp. PD_36]
MALLTSKTLIQCHAAFLFILAVYLTKSPELITDSDLVYMLGEAMKIDINPTFSRPQSPFALCGILLVADALVDLIIVTKIPQINEILAYATATTAAAGPQTDSGANTNDDTAAPGALHNSATRAGALYSEIWTLLAASRFCLFFAVSFFIYHSKPGAWGVTDAGLSSDSVPSGVDQLKNRVVFTYGFMEMVFWFWVRGLIYISFHPIFA